MEVASLERLKENGVDSLGLGQVASIERVAYYRVTSIERVALL